MNIEFMYESTNVKNISETDYIRSFNIENNLDEPRTVNEIIHSTIESSDQLKIVHELGSLTVSKNTKVFTEHDYKLASELTLSDKVLINEKFHPITSIESDTKPVDFVDFNIANNSNFYVSTEKEKMLIHNSGACCIYFNWWHLDVIDLLSLKSNGGTDENRARALQYAIKLNQNFIDAVINDDSIYLFDPRDVPNLHQTVGEEFNKHYDDYINKSSVKKRKMKARELWSKIFKERSETGNIYLTHEENINNASLLNRYIGSSNLCTEIVLPSRPSESISEQLVTMEDGDKRIIKTYKAGEIALCNLSSVNLERWFYMDESEKTSLISTIVRALDNTVDEANYPVKEGKNSNLMYRYLGIGVLNYTNYLALKKIVIDSDEALEETDALFDDLSYRLISTSVDLAIEKGKFPKFYDTEWSKGILPIHKANKKAIALTKYEPDMERWNKLAERVKTFGIRNAQLMAIAPTACQTKNGKIITEKGVKSLEQIMNEQGIDHVGIELEGKQQWIEFKQPLTIPTRFGNKQVNNIWYNGKVQTRKITFEDGNTYEFSLNHKLLVKTDDRKEYWVQVKDLTENMEIVEMDPK